MSMDEGSLTDQDSTRAASAPSSEVRHAARLTPRRPFVIACQFCANPAVVKDNDVPMCATCWNKTQGR